MFLLVLKAFFLSAAEFLKGSKLGAEEGRAEQTELWEWVGILADSTWEPGCVAASPPAPRGVCAWGPSSAQHPDALVPAWLQKDTLCVRRGMFLCSIKQLVASQLSASLSALACNPG